MLSSPVPAPARTFPLQALFCAALLLVAELLARPFANFGIADEWSYDRTAKTLAETGHIVYNGWSTAMLGWQLYPAALLIRLFGYSPDVCRMSTLAASVLATFVLQRIFVRAGIRERNATIATLALVLSPIYMELSVTFMTDISGLLALLLSLYACLRALQAATEKATIGWLFFAAAASAVIGSARQLGWLGVLVMVPCALWLMRRNRKVVAAGALFTLGGWAFIAWCLHWSAHQPYFLVEGAVGHLNGLHDLGKMIRELARGVLELPFLIMTLLTAFLIDLRRNGRAFWVSLALFAVLYTGVAIKLTPSHGPGQILEPLLNDWLSPAGFYYPSHNFLASAPPVVLGTAVRVLLTAFSLLVTFATVAFLLRVRKQQPLAAEAMPTTWYQLLWLTVPTVLAYSVLLIPRSLHELFDRYLIGLTPFVALLLVRAFQQYVRPQLPRLVPVLVGVVALFSVGSVHDLFALDRARAALAAEVTSSGVRDTALAAGFEYNYNVELEHSAFINDVRMVNPPGLYKAMEPNRAPSCDGKTELDEQYRHGMPQLGLAFEPNACAGATAFAPVSYSSWLKLQHVSLYVVRFQGPY
jgi:hypothetical protein